MGERLISTLELSNYPGPVTPELLHRVESGRGRSRAETVLEPGTVEEMRFNSTVDYAVACARNLVEQLTQPNPGGEL